MIEVIKYHLQRSCAISFDPNDDSPMSLEQPHFGLSVVLGEDYPNNLLTQIGDEKEIQRTAEAEA